MTTDVLLGDALEALIDYRGKTPRKLGSDFVSEGVPVVSANNVRDGRLDLDDVRFVAPDVAVKWMSTTTRKGDVILTSEAPVGRVARVPSDDPLVLGQRLFGLRGRPDVLDNGFLYYALQTNENQHQLEGRSTATTVSGIRHSTLLQLRLRLPQIHQQVAIAEVLGALDDKIAVNSTLADRLVRLTDQIFRRARDGAPARVVTFDEVATAGGGGTPSTKVADYWDGDVLWVTPTDVTALGSPYLDLTARRITSAGLAKCSSALYPVDSILMTSRATIGAFALAKVPVAVNQGFIVAHAKDRMAQLWLFHEMRSRVDDFLAHANGATFLELSKGKFKALQVAWPDDPAAFDGFKKEIGPLHDRAYDAAVESRRLAELRDTLLPHLMSGRITVREAEKQVEEVL